MRLFNRTIFNNSVFNVGEEQQVVYPSGGQMFIRPIDETFKIRKKKRNNALIVLLQ